jgi:dihydrofolate reductase
LPKKPLPNRKNIVLTDNPHETIENAITAYSLEDSLAKCIPGEEIFIIGGGSIYRQFMQIADRLFITHVHRKALADIYFPEIDKKIWEVTEKEEFTSEDIPYTYTIYRRRK